MAHQYQAYSKPTYDGIPTQSSPQAHSPLPPFYAHSPNPYSAGHPRQSTFAPPPHEKMAGMQQPDVAHRPQLPMNEKSQLPMPGHAHENAQGSYFGRDWTFGLFDCFSPCSTCCLGCWCPCLLFGKTFAREHGDGESNGCGAMCCVWYLTTCVCFNSCLQCVMRGQQRERHGIEGSTFGDFCGSLWCGCCTLIQEEKESVVRMTGIDPKTKVAYQPINQGMHYPA